MMDRAVQTYHLKSTGYLMIQAVDLYNFRGFKDLGLRDLKRFNIIVGPNASGKTALLESIFLPSANSPEVSFRFRKWRGFSDTIQISLDKTVLGALWKDLFWNEEPSLSVILHDSEHGVRACRVFYEPNPSITLPLGPQSDDASVTIPVYFEWTSGEKTFTAQVQVTGKGLTLPAVEPSLFPSIFLPSAPTGNPAENASRYSELSKENREGEILEGVRAIYPFVEGLSTEINAGVPMVYAAIVGQRKKIPIPLLSEGANKYLSILLAAHFASRGVLLIDEIENGLYHETLGSIWAGVVAACQRDQTQLFVTTHSMECLRALSPILEKNADEFCLLRTRRVDGHCEVKKIDGSAMLAAIQEGFEIR